MNTTKIPHNAIAFLTAPRHQIKRLAAMIERTHPHLPYFITEHPIVFGIPDETRSQFFGEPSPPTHDFATPSPEQTVAGSTSPGPAQGQPAPASQSPASPRHLKKTPRAQHVLALAQNAAIQRGDNYLGTKHILLGILELGQGIAFSAIRNVTGNPDLLRENIAAINAAWIQSQPEIQALLASNLSPEEKAKQINLIVQRIHSTPSPEQTQAPSTVAAQALKDAAQLLVDISRNEVNATDEAIKWVKAYPDFIFPMATIDPQTMRVHLANPSIVNAAPSEAIRGNDLPSTILDPQPFPILYTTASASQEIRRILVMGLPAEERLRMIQEVNEHTIPPSPTDH